MKASHLSRSPLLTTPLQAIRDDYQINIVGTLYLTQLLAPLLVNTAASRERSRTVIFNVGTAGSRAIVPYWGLQLSTKVRPNVQPFFFPFLIAHKNHPDSHTGRLGVVVGNASI